MLKKAFEIFSWIFIFQLIGYLLGRVTQENIQTWYMTLDKSSLTPSALVFPIVWSTLYTMIALAGWSLWHHRKHPEARLPILLYSLQMLMNWSWTPLFFSFHLIGFSFFWLLALTLLTGLTILKAKHKFKFSSAMLLPYFFWLVFASYLNGSIWVLNKL